MLVPYWHCRIENGAVYELLALSSTNDVETNFSFLSSSNLSGVSCHAGSCHSCFCSVRLPPRFVICCCSSPFFAIRQLSDVSHVQIIAEMLCNNDVKELGNRGSEKVTR